MDIYIEGNTLHIGSETLDLSHLPPHRVQTLQEALWSEQNRVDYEAEEIAANRAQEAADDAMAIAIDLIEAHTETLKRQLEKHKC